MIVKKRLDPRSRWFPEARFGMFVHFGVYALLQRGEWVMYHENIPRGEYEKLARRFNPKRFDAAEWVGVAQDAGARYVCVTAKHHDGFCLFDSALTDYKITNTPFKRDLIGELAAGCQRAGMRILFYYSQPDWHHPNYVNRKGAFKDLDNPPKTDRPDWPRFQEYLEGQVLELVTNYGRVDGIWFDGSHKTEEEWRGKRLYRLIKQHQPHAVVNDRGRYGDFFTPERRIRDHLAGYTFEVCESVSPTSWGYQGDTDSHSVPHLVGELVRVASLGGNYLLNVGPKPDGTIPREQVKRMRAIGAWLETNGEAIYRTNGCRLVDESESMRFTRKGRTIYVYLRQWPATNRLFLPSVRSKPQRARLIGSRGALNASLTGKGCQIAGLPMVPPVLPVSVVALDFRSEPKLHQLRPRPPRRVVVPVSVKDKTVLAANDASLRGLSVKGVRLSCVSCDDGSSRIAGWFSPEHHAVWRLGVKKAGTFAVAARIACSETEAGAVFEVAVSGQVLRGETRAAGRVGASHLSLPPKTHRLGKVRLSPGLHQLVLRPTEPKFGCLFGSAESIILRPVKKQ